MEDTVYAVIAVEADLRAERKSRVNDINLVSTTRGTDEYNSV